MGKREKLLLVGGDIATPHAIKYCKEIGVYTIMTNDIPYENNPYKQMADEAWEIPVNDLDILEAKCREVGVTGVFAGVDEHNLDMTKALAQRLGLPFYASDEGWLCARDKLRFKQHCKAVGLDVPELYHLEKPFSPEVLKQIHYPVMVKPADSSGSRGITVCQREEELLAAFDNALLFSNSGKVVVEDYIDGKEFMIFACFFNEKLVIYHWGSNHLIPINGRRTMSFGTLIKENWHDWEEKDGNKIKVLCERLGCKQGCFFLQGAFRDGRYYLYEMGYRLDGLASWKDTPGALGFSPLELQVDAALARNERWSDFFVDVKAPKYIQSMYQIYPRIGKISKIVGFEALQSMDKVKITLSRYKEGDEVVPVNSFFQMAFALVLSTKDESDTYSLLKEINETIHFYDENGKDMLLYFDDYSIFGVDDCE